MSRTRIIIPWSSSDSLIVMWSNLTLLLSRSACHAAPPRLVRYPRGCSRPCLAATTARLKSWSTSRKLMPILSWATSSDRELTLQTYSSVLQCHVVRTPFFMKRECSSQAFKERVGTTSYDVAPAIRLNGRPDAVRRRHNTGLRPGRRCRDRALMGLIQFASLKGSCTIV